MNIDSNDFEVLMSAMFQENMDISEKTKTESNILIINQCDKDGFLEEKKEYGNLRMISCRDRGLSKSRNLALDNAKGNICLLCDDDEELHQGYKNIILDAYSSTPQADVIIFNNRRINYKHRKTYYKISKIRKAPVYRGYGSTMITFRLDRVRGKNIRFNEQFGAGSSFGGGEDNLFLSDMRKVGLIIYENPGTIATIDYSKGSQWFDGYTNKYFYNLGAFYEHQFERKYLLKYLRCYYTCYRLRSDKQLNSLQKMKWMHKGMKGFSESMTYDVYMEANL